MTNTCTDNKLLIDDYILQRKLKIFMYSNANSGVI